MPLRERPPAASVMVSAEGIGPPSSEQEKVGGARRQKMGGAKRPTSGAPPKNSVFAPPKKQRQIGRGKEPKRRGGWIEFKPGAVSKKTGERMYYAKRRRWVRVDGKWKKVWKGRVQEIPPMTKLEKDDYVKRKQRAKESRSKRRGSD